MRELKFRAWDKITERYYVVDGLGYDNDGNLCEIYLAGIQIGESNPNADVRNPSDVILEQYTGLKDKNGREIYEGDIFEDDYNGGYEVVKWIDERSAFCLCYMGYERDVEEFYTRCTNEMEVIGNIHENKELLREE